MREYRTVCAEAEDEFVEKRSRFIGAIAPVGTPQEAAAFVAARRLAHRDARHTVWAYRLAEGDARYSDDGEPQGTGGHPVLEVLRREALTNVCIAVTRYFGGILLGAGGLTRAYSTGASLAVAAARICWMRPCTLLRVVLDYAQYGTVSRLLPAFDAKIEDAQFAQDVTVQILLREERRAEFVRAVTEVTAATARVQQMEQRYAAWPS